VPDGELREALASLGRAVLAVRKPHRKGSTSPAPLR